jgi:hypothetical protein
MSESGSEELDSITEDTTYLRAGVRNCHLRGTSTLFIQKECGPCAQ